MNSSIKRTNNALVPDSEELKVVLEMEATRDLPEEKKDIHYPDFTSVIRLFEHYEVPTTIFTDDSLSIYEVVDIGRELTKTISEKVLEKEQTEKEIYLFNTVYDYLSEEDTPNKSDVIILFGSKTPFRPKKAAELYKKGLAKKILVTGSRPVYAKGDEEKESEVYEQILIEEGVPEDAIIKEEQAISLVDNVRRSLNLLDEIHYPYTSLILVNSPYTQRRGWCLFKKLLPDTVSVYRVNCETGEQYKKENWYKQEHTLQSILTELIKMRASVVYNSA